jgi:hypothetical protein
MIAVFTSFERVTLGDSLQAPRFQPAIAAGLNVLLTGLIAGELDARQCSLRTLKNCRKLF